MSKRTAAKIAPGTAPDAVSEGLDLTPELRALWDATREKRELARQLVRMRSAAGLSQKELADRMGKDQAYVSRMESATHPMPKGQSIALYARSCGYVTAYAFLRPEDGPKDSAMPERLRLQGMMPIGQDRACGDALARVEDVAIECR